MLRTTPRHHPDPEENERLDALYGLGILDTPPHDWLHMLVQRAAHSLGTPWAAFTVVDRDRVQLVAAFGFARCDVPRTGTFSAQAAYLGQVLVIPDTLDDPRFASQPFVVDEPRIRFYAGAPVRAASGHVIGTVCVLDRTPRPVDQVDRALLVHLADCISNELLTRHLVLGASNAAGRAMADA